MKKSAAQRIGHHCGYRQLSIFEHEKKAGFQIFLTKLGGKTI
jgi:hypothetical protein